jgi:hypothetical protein
MDDNTTEPMKEFAVSLSIKEKSHHSSAFLVDKTDQWALLKIAQSYDEHVCPKETNTKSVVRLNLKPTLKASSIFSITPEEIIGSRCFLVGFNTTDKGGLKFKLFKIETLSVSILEHY